MNLVLIEEPYLPIPTESPCVNSSADQNNLPIENHQKPEICKFERSSNDNILNSQNISQAQPVEPAANLEPGCRGLESEEESNADVHSFMFRFENKKKNISGRNELRYSDTYDDILANLKREAAQNGHIDRIQGEEEAPEYRDNSNISFSESGHFYGFSTILRDLSEVTDPHERRMYTYICNFIGEMNFKPEFPNDIKAYPILLEILKMMQENYPTFKDKDLFISQFKEKVAQPFAYIQSFLQKWDQMIKFMKAEERFRREWQQQTHESSRFKTAQEEFIKEWGQQTKSFDFENVEKALNYLLVCNDLKLIDREYEGLLDHLQNSIQEYSRCVRARMNNCFSAAANFQKGNIKELQQDVEGFCRDLEDVLIIKNKYSEFYRRFDNNREIIQTWKKNLARCLINQTNELKNLRGQVLNQRLLVIKSLGPLDIFLDQEKQKFTDVYVQYQNLIHETESNDYNDFEKALKHHDYEEIKKILSKDNLRMYQRQIRDKLNQQLKILIEDTKRKLMLLQLEENIVPKKIQDIIHNQKRLQQAKELPPRYLSVYEEVNLCITEIKQNLSHKEDKSVEAIGKLISNHNFYEAETKIARMISFWNVTHKSNASAQLQEIEESIETTLNELVATYAAREFKDYVIISPKNLYNNLKKVIKKKNMYKKNFISLENEIFNRVRKELEAAKEIVNVNNFHMKSVESILSYLPDKIKKRITLELEECRNHILKTVEEQENTIRIRNMATLIQRCKEQGLKAYTQIQTFIPEKMRNIKENFILFLGLFSILLIIRFIFLRS